MRHAYLVAVATIFPACLPKNLTLRETLNVQYDRLWIRPYWRIVTRWIGRILIAAGFGL